MHWCVAQQWFLLHELLFKSYLIVILQKPQRGQNCLDAKFEFVLFYASMSYLLNFLQLNQSDRWAPKSDTQTAMSEVLFSILWEMIFILSKFKVGRYLVKMYVDKNLNGTTKRIWIHCKSHTWPDGHSSLWRLIITKAIMIKGMLLVCLLLSKDGGTNHNIIHSPFFWTFFLYFSISTDSQCTELKYVDVNH